MPELPEVETVRRQLAPEVVGRSVDVVRVHHADILMNLPDESAFAERVVGRRIDGIDRRGKYLLFRLSGPRLLEVQLRMTGRFALGRDRPDPGEYGHLAARIGLDDGRSLWYDDVRRLGGFRLVSREAWLRRDEELGPEPLGADFGPARLAAELEGRRAPVKNLLLDQRRVAGVGNIYACESLHRAGIDPRRPGGSLGDVEVERLHGALRSVLERALDLAGTSFRDFRRPDGGAGGYQSRLAVYRREGAACHRCGAAIRRTVQAGRGTFFCPGCQG